MRRQETNEAILKQSRQGTPIRLIVRQTGHSRKLARDVLRGQRSDVFRTRPSSLENWSRLAEKADQSGLARTPSARAIARLMTSARDDLTKSEAILGVAIEGNVPELVVTRTAILDFQSMIRSKAAAKLDDWVEAAKESLVGSFAYGVGKDIAAIRNAIISPSSNGQTEGQTTQLKLIKRQMHGRAKIDLLQTRLFGATQQFSASKSASEPILNGNIWLCRISFYRKSTPASSTV